MAHQDRPGHASHSPHLPPIHDSRQAPPASDAWTEAFTRLQQQVQYNTNAVEDQRRHLDQLSDVIRSLHTEVGTLWRHVDAHRDQLEKRLEQPASKPEVADIDVLTSQLQHISNKANEVDGLKVQLEIMTRRLRRVEGHPSPPPPPTAYQQVEAHPYAQQSAPTPAPATSHQHPAQLQSTMYPPASESRVAPPASQPHPSDSRHSRNYSVTHESRHLPSVHAVEAAPETADYRSSAMGHPGQHGAAAAHVAANEAPTHAGWATVNSNPAKRPASFDAGSNRDTSAPSSPKRQKLATLMPRASHDQQAQYHQHTEDVSMHSQRGGPSHEHGQVLQNGLRFVQFPGANEAPIHKSWRGDGDARRAREREAGSHDQHSDHEMKQEERHEWHGAPAGYEGPYGQQQHHYALSPESRDQQNYDGHPVSTAPETPSPAFQEANKKSRTKPTRNANGILIRKDGRPDMRSISSAQNLRKVHAKKEAERNGEAHHGSDPTSATSSHPTYSSVDDKSSIADGDSPTSTAGTNEGHREERGYPGAPVHMHTGYGHLRGQSRDQKDTPMMDSTEASMRERHEKAVEQPQRHEAHALVA